MKQCIQHFLAVLIIAFALASMIFISGCDSESQNVTTNLKATNQITGNAMADGTKITRILSSSSVNTGEILEITLSYESYGSYTYYAIEETVPDGWTVINDGGGGTPQQNLLKWVMFAMSPLSSASYTYTARAPTSSGSYTFSGKYMIEGMDEEEDIEGNVQVTVSAGTCTPVTEVCDGIDNDCDGSVDEGFGAEDCSAACIAAGGENYMASRDESFKCCGDQSDEASPYESTESSCTDNQDNDCNGFVDDDDSLCHTCESDSDCDDAVFCNGEETCNEDGVCEAGIVPTCDDSLSCTSDFCDLDTDQCDNRPTDVDKDGFNTCESSAKDCDDTNKDVNVNAVEICSNSIDDDCDKLVDSNDPDCGGNPENNLTVGCVPNWSAGSWGQCKSGFKYRTVTDLNNCGKNDNKPNEVEACVDLGNCNDNLMNGNELGIDCGGRCTKSCTPVKKGMSLNIKASPIKAEILDIYDYEVIIENRGNVEINTLDISLDKASEEVKTIDSLPVGAKTQLSFKLKLPADPDTISIEIRAFSGNDLIAKLKLPVQLTVPAFSLKRIEDPEDKILYSVMIVDNRYGETRKVSTTYNVMKEYESYLLDGISQNIPEGELYYQINKLNLELPNGNYEVESSVIEKGKDTETVTTYFVVSSGKDILNVKIFFYILMAFIFCGTCFAYYKILRGEM